MVLLLVFIKFVEVVGPFEIFASQPLKIFLKILHPNIVKSVFIVATFANIDCMIFLKTVKIAN